MNLLSPQEMTAPEGDWPQKCQEDKDWCVRMINSAIEIKNLEEELFGGSMPDPQMPQQQKEEVHLKCHQSETCVEKAVEQFKQEMRKVRNSVRGFEHSL